MSSEAEIRKNRSIEILKKHDIPYLDDLPMIETEDEAEFRSVEEIARRAMITIITASYAAGLTSDKDVEDDREFYRDLLDKYDLMDAMTSREQKFMAATVYDQKESVQISWRYEAGLVLMWALGLVPELYYPDKICNTEQLVGIIRDHDTFDSFMVEVEPRKNSEILDEADLIYRYRWAAVDAIFIQKLPVPPGGMDRGVLVERHVALNWLIGLGDDYESVPLDT